MAWAHYATVEDHDAYHFVHGNPSDWSGASPEAKVQALIVASEYVDMKYGTRWKGRRTSETQILDWPRTGVYDADQFYIDKDTLPQALKDVVSILALESVRGVDLMPDTPAGEVMGGSPTLKKEKVDVIEEVTEWAPGSASVSTAPTYPRISRMLRAAGLIEGSGRANRG